MTRSKSNGDNYSPNERTLEGQLVVVREHRGRIRAIGKLIPIKANTRGNMTLGVVWKQVRPADGRLVRRDLPIWTLRERPFTIEAYLPDNARVDEVAWVEARGAVFRMPEAAHA